MSEYKIGECQFCKRVTALKDGLCAECSELTKCRGGSFLEDLVKDNPFFGEPAKGEE